VRLNQLIDQAPANGLRFPPFEPGWPQAQWPKGSSVFERLRKGDLLLHHPFQCHYHHHHRHNSKQIQLWMTKHLHRHFHRYRQLQNLRHRRLLHQKNQR
jgi:hypothetical protein